VGTESTEPGCGKKSSSAVKDKDNRIMLRTRRQETTEKLETVSCSCADFSGGSISTAPLLQLEIFWPNIVGMFFSSGYDGPRSIQDFYTSRNDAQPCIRDGTHQENNTLIELIETTGDSEAGFTWATGTGRDSKKKSSLLAPYQISLGLAGTGRINSLVHSSSELNQNKIYNHIFYFKISLYELI
jgi:hypothetical protein